MCSTLAPRLPKCWDLGAGLHFGESPPPLRFAVIRPYELLHQGCVPARRLSRGAGTTLGLSGPASLKSRSRRTSQPHEPSPCRSQDTSRKFSRASIMKGRLNPSNQAWTLDAKPLHHEQQEANRLWGPFPLAPVCPLKPPERPPT